MFSLAGKTVVVTGGGRGIGKAIALAMAECGARVVVTGRNAEVLAKTVQEIEARGVEGLALAGDITTKAEIDRIVSAAVSRFGYINCWVNNAGSADASDVGKLIDLTEKQFDSVVDLNLKWTFFAAQAAARAMTHGGSIINISSRSGSFPCPMTGQYGAAKAGVESLTGTMAVEWGHLGIRVNAVAPGVVVTEKSVVTLSESRLRRQIETIPLRRLGEVSDVAPLCVYFASDESRWVSGTVVQVNGGSRIPVGLLTYLHKVSQHPEVVDA